ncbi:hypothetical protein GOBAR_AA34458 [Gossypium barbadense]|uniref:Aspartic peptidase DDI1-type domain-containing protein n=1 Tax=Gossypium barbadense TaxID=3634 RepID=A0A2P5W581_GOSBA|nr:hypothetical protein GOBAR_AA34458 [Gossypium barbadense]
MHPLASLVIPSRAQRMKEKNMLRQLPLDSGLWLRNLSDQLVGEGYERRMRAPTLLMLEMGVVVSGRVPPKLKDSGSFTNLIEIGGANFGKALCDLGTSINLLSLSIYHMLGLDDLKETLVTLQPADKSLVHPKGVLDDVLMTMEVCGEVENFKCVELKPKVKEVSLNSELECQAVQFKFEDARHPSEEMRYCEETISESTCTTEENETFVGARNLVQASL